MKLKDLVEERIQDFSHLVDNQGSLNLSDYYSRYNIHLTSLRDCPRKINGSLRASGNRLSNLEGAPLDVRGDFYAIDSELTSLEGAPKDVGGNVYISNNALTTIEHMPSTLGNIHVSNNKITSLPQAHLNFSMIGTLNLNDNPLESHLLGLLFIPGCFEVIFSRDLKEVQRILNFFLRKKHSTERLNNDGIYECQDMLIDKGFDEFAKL